MQKIVSLGLVLSTLSGCAALDRINPFDRSPDRRAAAADAAPVTPPPQNPMVMGEGRSAAVLDTSSEAEKAAALAVPAMAAERELGRVTVSLGSPAEAGFWLRSPLVGAAGKGRVQTAGGQSVAVDLLPGQSGAQLSLAAFRALGLSLTDLPEVTVFAQ